MATKRTTQDSNILDSIYEGLFRKKANNVVLIDLTRLDNAIGNYFIVCDAESGTQVKALAESVEEIVFTSLSQKPWHIEGIENQQWILLDYGDILVHVFQKPFRDFYRLEDLWADGKLINIEDTISKKKEKQKYGERNENKRREKSAGKKGRA